MGPVKSTTSDLSLVTCRQIFLGCFYGFDNGFTTSTMSFSKPSCFKMSLFLPETPVKNRENVIELLTEPCSVKTVVLSHQGRPPPCLWALLLAS